MRENEVHQTLIFLFALFPSHPSRAPVNYTKNLLLCLFHSLSHSSLKDSFPSTLFSFNYSLSLALSVHDSLLRLATMHFAVQWREFKRLHSEMLLLEVFVALLSPTLKLEWVRFVSWRTDDESASRDDDKLPSLFFDSSSSSSGNQWVEDESKFTLEQLHDQVAPRQTYSSSTLASF